MSSIAILTMVRNEAGRYLRSALDVWGQIGKVIALDDSSDDDTADMLRAAGAEVDSTRTAQLAAAWGAEWLPRKMLWDMGLASGADWLLWLDADMIPARDPNDLIARDVDALAFRLYDLWNWAEPTLMYRYDGPWQAHTHARTWMIRRPLSAPEGGWQWNQRGIHCGHLPQNYRPRRTLIAPQEYSLLHYGYARELDRWAKATQYSCQTHQLSAAEYAHALTITDAAVVGRLPIEPQWRLTHHADTLTAASASSSEPASGSPSMSLMPTMQGCATS